MYRLTHSERDQRGHERDGKPSRHTHVVLPIALITTRSRRRRSNPRSIVDLRQWPKGGPAMKLSARNQIKGKVVEVRKGTTTAHVRIDIGNGVTITSSITNEAVDDLGLRAGDGERRHSGVAGDRRLQDAEAEGRA